MPPDPRRYAALEATALAAQRQGPIAGKADPYAFSDDPGPHSRLVSAFAWHPLMRRDLGLPPLRLFLMGWLSAVILHVWSRIPQPWSDEAFTWELAQGDWSYLLQRLATDLHPPLYFALAKLGHDLGLTDFLQLRVALYGLVALPLGLLPLLIQSWPPIWRRFACMAALVLVLFPFDLYLVQLRYYGLLALLIALGVIALGNWLDSEGEERRWLPISQVAFGAAALTNYQTWLIWIVALVLASRCRIAVMAMWRMAGAAMTATMLSSFGVLALAGSSPLAALFDAGSSPFTSGFGHLLLEIVARCGVLLLATVASEMVPLWWMVMFVGVGIIWWRLGPHPAFTGLSRTAFLCLQTALVVGVVMAVLTATLLPVGVEFLPARLACVIPLFWLGATEWLLRRHYHLRHWLVLLLVHWLMLGSGYLLCAEALGQPAPAAGAPFLHATYLTPVPGVVRVLQEATDPDEPAGLLICATPGLELAMGRHLAPIPHVDEQVMWSVMHRVPESWPLEWFVLSSTREETIPPALRDALAGALLEEEWYFVREDPLWYLVKSRTLDRSVAPYKYRLARYSRNSAGRVR